MVALMLHNSSTTVASMQQRNLASHEHITMRSSSVTPTFAQAAGPMQQMRRVSMESHGAAELIEYSPMRQNDPDLFDRD